MGSFSPIHWIVVLAVILLLFGGGNKISNIMGDVARGIKSFRKNITDDESMEDGIKKEQQSTLSSSIPQSSLTQKEETFSKSGSNDRSIS